MTTMACVIASYGGNEWARLAADRALPSATDQTRKFDQLVIHHEPDGSLMSCRNAAATEVTSEYLVFLDADDELHPTFADAIDEAIEAHVTATPVARGFTPAVAYTAGRRRPPGRIWPRQNLHDGNWLVIGTVVPTAAFRAVGGFHDWPLYEDWCLWQRMERETGIEWVEVPDALYVAHANQQSRNRSPSRQAKLAAHHEIRRANYPELYEEER